MKSDRLGSAPFTAARWSTLLGLWSLMLLSLPRYWIAHDQTRLVLLAVLWVAVSLALIVYWRFLITAERERCPDALKHLGLCLIVGWALIGLWHWVEATPSHLAVLLSQGCALGLLIHVVRQLWRRSR